nr:leucine-rich repeat extensin-like protein 3 [Coffea arabica]
MKAIYSSLLVLLLIPCLMLLQQLGHKASFAMATRHQALSALTSPTGAAASSHRAHLSYELQAVPKRIMRGLHRPRTRPPPPNINHPTHFRRSMPYPPLEPPPPSFAPPPPPPGLDSGYTGIASAIAGAILPPQVGVSAMPSRAPSPPPKSRDPTHPFISSNCPPPGCVNKAYVALAAARVLEEPFSALAFDAPPSFSHDALSHYDFRAALRGRTRRPRLSPPSPVINTPIHFKSPPPPSHPPPSPPLAPAPPPPC